MYLHVSAKSKQQQIEIRQIGKNTTRHTISPPNPPATHKIIEYKTINKLLTNKNKSVKNFSLVK
jgi:phosphatidylethanolamine-binding protein (PEBP) family uncharacterized protein